MLEGLEVSEERFSNSILNNKYSGRFEAEFFHKKYKQIFQDLKNKEFEELGKLVFLTDGEHGNAITFPEGFAKYYGARNVLSGILDENNVEYITEEHHYKIRKSKLYPNDILISCVGANIGYASIVPDYVGEANIVRNVALIRTTDKRILNHYLLSYFQSKYGKDLFIRMATGNAQPLVSLDYIKTIPVFIPSLDFQKEIKRVVEKAKESLVQSTLKYTEAENILLQELGLSNWQPTIKNNNTKTLKESFLSSGRIDAEYYQPKYDELLQVLKQFNHDTLGNLVSIQKSIEPGSDAYQNEGIPFIRVANLSKNGISESDVFLSKDEFGDFPVMPKKNTILLSKDGSVGIAYKVEEDMKAITSGAILHLTVASMKVLPDYLTLVLNSVVVKLQSERDAGGSIIQHWKPDEIKQVIIPVIDDKIQKTIAEKMQQSFSLLSKSHQLLEAAKRAVEIAIEQSEKAALDYLNNY